MKRILKLAILFCLITGVSAHALPVISNDEITSVTDTTAIITWATTNETSDTQVYYGISSANAHFTSSESTNYHYAVLTNLSPGTTYIYFVKSGSAEASQKAFTTLTPPTGQYLFTFATLSDPQYGMGKADTTGARGRPYSHGREILEATVTSINSFSPAFTILKGDMIEDQLDPGDVAYGEYINTPMPLSIDPLTETIKQKFDKLTKASDAIAKYYPIPGNHDKALTSYTGGTTSSWYTKNLTVLYHALTVSDPTVSSTFNYSFVYSGYRFIMLDSVKSNLSAEVNTTFLTTELASASATGQKCFIFLHHPATDLRSEGIPAGVISDVTGGSSTDYSKVQITNTVEVQALITTYKDIVAGVFSGHIHDNHYQEISGVPYVRTSSGIQYPVGFDIYKVYSNGYLQTFYKVPNWTEIARASITPEAGFSESYWEQFSLGPTTARNFSHTLSAAPPSVSSITPLSAETSVPINSNIIITFSKAMSSSETQSAISFNPSISGATYTWLSSSKLSISHSDLSSGTTYTITVGTGAKDSSGTAVSSASIYTFATGTGGDTTPPNAAFDKFTYNITGDNQPTFTGIATDTASVITSIECRIDDGAWYIASPLDGAFNSTIETFTFRAQSTLLRGTTAHTIEARCYDAARNVKTSGFDNYSFYVVGDKPEISVTSNNLTIISGDPINKQPSFEVNAISNNGLVNNALNAIIDGGTPTPLTKVLDPTNNGKLTATFNPTLIDGTHSLVITMSDDSGNVGTKEIVGLSVQTSSDISLQGVPLSYPNPYNGIGSVNIAYTLSKNNNITLTIHDLMGNQLVKKTYSSGLNGAKAGYNEISWDGKTDSGQDLGNGIYIYLIIADGKVISKGKLSVVR